ncbi:MAG TPA: hypothetical protein VKD72_14365 [Gemmataceae bacterium]|nr:hypothetical protein [Gemmataceae bacterium]
MILAGALPKVKRFFRHACLSLATVGLLARPSRDEKTRSGWRWQRRFGLALGGTRGPVARQGPAGRWGGDAGIAHNDLSPAAAGTAAGVPPAREKAGQAHRRVCNSATSTARPGHPHSV